ncbi:hypothetical protein [Vitiosangium sp. GDMCC 1.1324]|uniref:hypothetical protein n=1 Tax=Vitiosangium sp. (strain GDMCC 1.1324) TaxID=2138576 RepID=UPI000D387260|nr:hypothetical protein [Vitiosangium sp. GDMCC 1.1324]PTL78922.1 hypothetical protein DAT35_35425 [Vitiosangium sp. GDMCC 1.1324]
MLRFLVKRPVNIDSTRGAKLRRALDLLEQIVNSDVFRSQVLEHKAYTWNQGLTNEQIYNRLIWGAANPTADVKLKDRIVQFDYELVPRPWYKQLSKTIGWRIPGTNDIYTYANSFDHMSVAELASHLGHEVVGHLAGEFDHPELASRERAESVPYVIDGFIEALATQKPVPEAA